MYRVIKRFYDVKSNHAYSVWDTFPHDGVEIDAKRIAELVSGKNRLGVPLIKEIQSNPPKPKKKKNSKGAV